MSDKYNRRKKGNAGRIIRIDGGMGTQGLMSEDQEEYDSDEESEDVNEEEVKA